MDLRLRECQNSQQLWKATKEILRTTIETEKVFLLQLWFSAIQI